jgi:hypothetical protein
MKLVKAAAIALFIGMLASVVGLTASAQSPSASSATSAPVGNIPEKPPQFWTASGETQAQWTALREHCRTVFSEMAAIQKMSPDQFKALAPIPPSDWESCRRISGAFSRPGQSTTAPAPAPSGATPPTSMPTPLPPAPPARSESSAANTSGPPGPGQSFAGGGASACQSPPAPNVGAQTPPLDVAADVSPSQNVEMLNQGLWVFNKSGTLQGSGPESLYTFWCGTVGANGNPLPACTAIGNPFPVQFTDTQIAYDAVDQRWLATTLIRNTAKETGDLFLAISTGTSALDGSGAWDRYDIPVCTTSNSGYNFPDQPILGYSSNWAAVDVVCLDSFGDETDGTDALVLVPNNSVASPPQTLSPTIITPPLFASRPARDMSGAANPYYPQLVVASAQFDTHNPPSAPPHVALYGIATASPGATPSPTLIGNSPNSWGFSGGGSNVIPFAPQTGCTVESSNCMISAVDQRRIQQATVQYNPKTRDHYLLTSFTAGYSNGAEALWYIDELETPGGNWAGQWTGTGSTGWVPTYTTITSDQDFDIDATLTSFTSSSAPFSLSLGWHEFPQMFGFPETTFASSTGVYTGQNTCPTPTPTGSVSPTPTPSATPTPAPTLQRWGDYNSLIWDPSLTSSSGEQGLFWSVAELSMGGTDQSTVWTQFNDALPYFIGPASNVESECGGGAGSTCKVTVNAPSGVQNGDVILVGIGLGEPAGHPPILPDSSWTLLTASNISGTPNQISAADSVQTVTVWVAAHIFGSVQNDSGSYTFQHYLNSAVELGTFLMVYRGAGQNLSNYTGYGFVRNGDHSSFTTGSVTPPGESQLVGMTVANIGCDEPYEPSDTFAAPSGSPALSPESPLTLPSGDLPWLGADVGVPSSGQSYGPYTYSATVGNGCPNAGVWLDWEVAVPEQ